MTSLISSDLSREIKKFYALFAISEFLIDSSIWSFYLTEYCQFSLTEAVAFQAGTTLVSGLLDLPTGSWADRFGRRRVVIIGFISKAIAAMLMIFAYSTSVLILAALAKGFGSAQLSGAKTALLHDNLKARGEEASFRRYMSNTVMMNYCSRTVAFVLSGILFSLHPTLPYITLAVALLTGAYCTALIRELPFEKTGASANREHIMQGVKVFLSTENLLRMSTLMLAGAILLEQLWISIQPLLLGAQMRPVQVGFSYALSALGSVLGARVGKALITRHRDELAFCSSLLVCGCGAVIFAIVESPVHLVIAQLITSIGFGLIVSSSGTILNSHLPSSHRAVCLSLFSTTEAIMIGLVGMPLGYLYENFNRAIPPIIIAVSCFVLVYPTYRALKLGNKVRPY